MKKFFYDATKKNADIYWCLNNAIKCIIATKTSSSIGRIVIISPVKGTCALVSDYLLSHGYGNTHGVYHLLGDTTNIFLESQRTYINIRTDAVIYFLLNSKEIFSIEENHSFAVEFAITDNNNISLWYGTWGANEMISNTTAQLLMPPSKVKSACDQITNACNITHTITFHPSDEELVKRILRTLVKFENPPVKTEEIFAYTKRECGWTLGLSNKLVQWLENLNTGKAIKGGKITATKMKEMYAKW